MIFVIVLSVVFVVVLSVVLVVLTGFYPLSAPLFFARPLYLFKSVLFKYLKSGHCVKSTVGGGSGGGMNAPRNGL